MQNVVNHADIDTDTNHDVASLLLLGRHGEDIFIITGNKILNSKVALFEKKISEINDIQHVEMREVYSEKLGKSTYSEKGGAGLGLLDIYKRSGRKLEYHIQPIDDQVSFLSLHVTVDGST